MRRAKSEKASPSEAATAIRVERVAKHYRRSGAGFRLRTLKSALLQGSLTQGLSSGQLITALDDVSFEVARGEAFGLIGGNGSGKSTMLKLVAGLMRPTAGTIDVEGRVAPLIELGAGFHPEISGLENIYINGAVLGLKRSDIERRLDDIVAFSGLEDFLHEPVKNYSSGMYVRLGFAVAIHTNPEVLLVDEVLAVGDEAFAHKCIHRIEEHLAAGGTLLFVSHSLGLVERLCDRVLWLENGQARALGSPRKVIDAYRQSVAAQEAQDVLEAHHREEAEAQQADEEPEDPDRWGSGEAVILNARMEVGGTESYLIESGGSAEIVMEVEARRPLEDFVFGVAITTPRGVEVWGTNTDMLGLVARRFDGRAEVRIRCDDLRLGEGDYEVDLAIHTRDGAPFDYRRRCLSFVARRHERGIGVYGPRNTWRFSGAVELEESPGDSSSEAVSAEAARAEANPAEEAPKPPSSAETAS